MPDYRLPAGISIRFQARYLFLALREGFSYERQMRSLRSLAFTSLFSSLSRVIRLAIALTFAVPAFRATAGSEVSIYAAASLSDSVKQAVAAYEKQTGRTVRFNFGASSFLALQIEEHAPADLFFSADEATMDMLEHRDLIVADTRRTLLSNSLVVVMPSGSSQRLNDAGDLKNAEWKRIALGQPDTVPAGVYARQYLTSMHLWDELKPKIIPTENVRAALAAVETENADAAFVYKTDALISKKVKVALSIDPSHGPPISYPIAVLKDAANPDGARKLEDYLSGPEARAVFEKYGFTFPH